MLFVVGFSITSWCLFIYVPNDLFLGINNSDNDLNAEVIGFGALNVDKLYSVENIVSKVIEDIKNKV